jgi:hypothetical protein
MYVFDSLAASWLPYDIKQQTKTDPRHAVPTPTTTATWAWILQPARKGNRSVTGKPIGKGKIMTN